MQNSEKLLQKLMPIMLILTAILNINIISKYLDGVTEVDNSHLMAIMWFCFGFAYWSSKNKENKSKLYPYLIVIAAVIAAVSLGFYFKVRFF